MSYRDDLEAAHALVASLQAQLAERGDAASLAYSQEQAQAHAERAQLNAQISELRRVIGERDATIKQLTGERDRLVERVNILQRERAKQAAPTPAPAPAPAKGKWPLLWDHNRRYDAVGGGRPASVACPQCWFENIESQMMRDTGLDSPTKSDNAYVDITPVVCPRCLFSASLRTR